MPDFPTRVLSTQARAISGQEEPRAGGYMRDAMASSAGPSDDRGAQQEELDAVMREVPRGALALSSIAVLLLLVGWFYVYFFVFVPRGAVG